MMFTPHLADQAQPQPGPLSPPETDRIRFSLAVRPALLGLLLALYAFTLSRLDGESLWADEAWSIWAASESWSKLLTHVASDVHPPLYFALLKGWIGLAGDSVFATRWLSAACGVIGLAVTAALARRLEGGWLAVAALLWLGTHGFLRYYLREVRMYSLLFALAALSLWSYGQWLRRPRLGWLAAQTMTTASLAYVHYFGPLAVLGQGLHLAWLAPRRLPHWLAAHGLALLLFAPWLQVLFAQLAAHPAGPHQSYTLTSWASIEHLAWVLSGGAGWWLLALVGLGLLLNRKRPSGDLAVLLVHCALLPPIGMMVINATNLLSYEPRNVITVLPALSLLVAVVLQRLSWSLLTIGALALLVATNLAAAAHLRPAKPDWAGAFAEVLAQRSADAPILLKVVEPSSVEAYYARLLPLNSQATIALPAAPVAGSTMRTLVDGLPASIPVWVVLPANIAESWAALDQLSHDRHVTQRRSVEYMLFYRFDPGKGEKLRFAFGDYLDYASEQVAEPQILDNHQSLCFDLRLAVRRPLAGVFSYGLHLVDLSGRLAAQVDAGLGDPPVGALLELAPCLQPPANLPPGDYAAHLVVYDWIDGARLPVLESGVHWGDALVVGVVEVGKL
jgi:hypothetical protein